MYERGRALTGDDLERWRSAVTDLVSIDVDTVVDLGSGTGIFTRAWSDWGARHVIACEPSAAMRGEAVRLGMPDHASLLAGRAEQIPLASGAIDIMWASAMVHHIGRPASWAREVGRVLKHGGWLLVRSFFADLGTTPWLPELPGAERARQRFPSVGSIAELLAPEGLHLVATTEVVELHHDRTPQGASAFIRSMRSADSLLIAFTDDEIAKGLERLERHPEGHLLDPVRLGLVAFRWAP